MGWRELAACAGHPDPGLFLDESFAAVARKVCATCPVAAECVADVNQWEKTNGRSASGTYGGMTHKQRTGRKSKSSSGTQVARQREGAICVVCGCHFVDKGIGMRPRFCGTTCGERGRYRRRNGRPESDAAQLEVVG